MSSIFQKLQFKKQKKILVLNSPDEFRPHLEKISTIARIDEILTTDVKYGFVLIFVKSCSEIIFLIQKIVPLLNPDALLWFAYPKKSSKKYQSDISRDQGWQVLGDAGFEAVRQIAIDDDWSALRFRRIEFIKTLTRNVKRIMSGDGKMRIQ